MNHSLNISAKPWIVHIPGLQPFSILENAHLVKAAGLCVFIWICLRLALDLTRPAWYERLNKNAAKKAFLNGTVIGLGYKFFTIPSCALAAYMTPPEDDIAGIHPSMNVYQQICWGSRGTVTILELFHFTSNRQLLCHHLLILVGMYIIAKYNGPHRGFDLGLGVVLSEIPNHFFIIFKELGTLSSRPTLDWALSLSSALTGLFCRIPAIVVAMAMVPTTGLQGGHAVIILVAYLFYLTYVLYVSRGRLRRAGVLREVGKGAFHLRLSSRLVISSTTFYTGVAAVGCQVTGLALYSFWIPTARSKLIEISWLSLPVTLAVVSMSVLVFSRLFRDNQSNHLSTIRAAMPHLSTVAGWTFVGWVMYIVFLAMRGETPEARNRNLTPADILSRQPAFCDLVLSWQFWVYTASAWVSSTLAAHFLQRVDSTEEGVGNNRVQEKR